MAKGIYIGGPAPQFIDATINITASNISSYFTVSNGSYYFVGNGSVFTTNNGGVASSTASTTLTALNDMDISFTYSYSSEKNYDKFTLIVNGTIIENAVSGSTTTKTYEGTLSKGQTISFSYTKDGSTNSNDDKCTFSNMVVYIQVPNPNAGASNVARKIKQPYVGVGNVSRKVKSGYVGVGGVARECFLGGTPVGELTVGSSVFMNIDGAKTEFLVVHKGLPSSVYDSSCDGIWLLMKESYEERAWHSFGQNSYPASAIHSYLNSTFLDLFDSDIQEVIKTVKIPHTNGTGSAGSVASGSSGLSAQVFLLSYTEVGFSGSSMANIEGAVLDYFDGAANSDRITNIRGQDYARYWWLRSPHTGGTSSVLHVSSDGSLGNNNAIVDEGIRPALILSNDTRIDESFNIIA